MRLLSSAIAVPLLLGLLAGGLSAQTETGQITGAVTDASGAAIPAAHVAVRSVGTGSVRNANTSADGTYTITNLLPGEYTVTVTMTGFATAEHKLTLTVGSRAGQDFRLEVASASATVDVTESSTQVNTETQTVGQVVNQEQIRELPNLTRNPYQFVALAGNVSDAGLGTRGAGFSINGQRESSTNILLDGGSNNDEYNGNIGQQVPLDAVQEFSVLTSNFTAEYGRASGGIVNVVTKSGSNDFHGTAYEFNRVSALSSNSFQNNATGQPKSVFARNQFGYSAGGPAIKNKLFFFSSTEWIRIRSNAITFAWVPTPDLIAQTPSNVQSFFKAYGQLRPSASILGTVSRSQLPTDPCVGLPCASLSPSLPLFNHVAFSVPTDAGGGNPQNTWMTVNRIDYNLSDRTQIYGRYALYSEVDATGGLSFSPYDNYDLGQTFYNHNGLASVIHTFSPAWVSQSKVVFNRLTNVQPGTTSRGIVPTMYAYTSGTVAIGQDNIGFPGYNPFTPGNGGAAGGPQNLLQLYEDMNYIRAGHAFRFGGTYVHQRDNRTFAAYQTAANGLAGSAGIGPTLSALLAGTYHDINVAVDPQGKFSCAVTPSDCQVKLPVSGPNFTRSNRYHEFALYAQDSWKYNPRLTVNLGLRWEYFGVQHNARQEFDANWYAPGVGFADDNLVSYLAKGGISLSPKSPIGRLWNPQYGNFGPRVGVAWDVFGDGKTSVRGGYGIGYERNFGNVTFNIIQNPPNYAVLAVSGPITTDNFGPLAGSSGSLSLPRVGARIVDPDIKTAHAHMWNGSIEHQFKGGVFWSAEYSGSKGVNLYSIAYPNQVGFGNLAGGTPCTGWTADLSDNDCVAQVNPGWGNSIGYRGNQGFSIYHGLNNRLRVSNLFNSHADVSLNYTWSHAIDNLSSTFFETGVQSQYGNSNITINNGNFVRGLMDPFHPGLDRGDAEFDIRQRVTIAGSWRIPFAAKQTAARMLLQGWSLNPMFVARTGQPFSIFDSTYQWLPYNTPRASFNGSAPATSNGLIATGTPNTYQYITFTNAQVAHVPMSFVPGSGWPSNMSGRDAFRAPGWWNLDLGVYKDTRITERINLQIRAEAFNLFNHANLYAVGNGADLANGNFVTACYGCTGSTFDRRHVQLGAKIVF
ncbi:MAG: TonB-dependent receptor [Acidobacteria bacterium]|nr:TonB-dependent receptor [Acidobacteriota bacterium]